MSKKSAQREREYEHFIGIDIAKRSFVVGKSDRKTVDTFTNDRKGFESFVKEYGEILKHSFITLEITGRYEMMLVHYLVEKEYHVHRARPIQIKNYIRSFSQKGKTDKLDAQALANYGQERHSRLEIFKMTSESLFNLNLLIQRRADLIDMQVKEKNRLQAPYNDFIKPFVQEMLDALEEKIKKIDEEIDVIFKASEVLQKKAAVAKTVPGVGPVVAKNLIVMIPELGLLDRKKIAGLVGLAPYPKDSGEASGYRKVAKGRTMAKRTLFIAAMAASRSHSELGEYYKRLIAAGKKPMIVMVALMRKILLILNARIKELIQKEALLNPI